MYKEIYMPNHYRARKNGCVLEHWLIAEEKIGRKLKPEEVVHHMDENKFNNNYENLIIFKNQSSHFAYHRGSELIETEEFGVYYCNINIFYCNKCGKEIKSYGICKKCSYEERRKVIRPSKEDLEKELIEYNFTYLSKKYGVSDNAIRKWCKYYGMSVSSKDYKKIKG